MQEYRTSSVRRNAPIRTRQQIVDADDIITMAQERTRLVARATRDVPAVEAYDDYEGGAGPQYHTTDDVYSPYVRTRKKPTQQVVLSPVTAPQKAISRRGLLRSVFSKNTLTLGAGALLLAGIGVLYARSEWQQVVSDPMSNTRTATIMGVFGHQDSADHPTMIHIWLYAHSVYMVEVFGGDLHKQQASRLLDLNEHGYGYDANESVVSTRVYQQGIYNYIEIKIEGGPVSIFGNRATAVWTLRDNGKGGPFTTYAAST